MGLLSKLGFVHKAESPPGINIHPEGLTHYRTLVAEFLMGAPIEVFNPTTREYEYCPNPIFDPAYIYRKQVSSTAYPQSSVAISAPFSTKIDENTFADFKITPRVTSQYSRGDIVESNDGKRFIVLGNKYDYLPKYDKNQDPDSGPLVVMRYDVGVKNAVSCRSLSGIHANKPAYSLRNKLIPEFLPAPTVTAEYLVLYWRKDNTAVCLCKHTGEVKFLPAGEV